MLDLSFLDEVIDLSKEVPYIHTALQAAIKDFSDRYNSLKELEDLFPALSGCLGTPYALKSLQSSVSIFMRKDRISPPTAATACEILRKIVDVILEMKRSHEVLLSRIKENETRNKKNSGNWYSNHKEATKVESDWDRTIKFAKTLKSQGLSKGQVALKYHPDLNPNNKEAALIMAAFNSIS